MTIRNDDLTVRNDERAGRAPGDLVDVAPGAPIDRVRWGSILAGAFASITILALLSALGAAFGLSAYDPGDDARRYAIGAGIWGTLSMLLAFGFGGWLAARSAAVRGRDNGLLNGFMVAGVGIPIILFALGSASVLMAQAKVASQHLVVTDGRFDGEPRPASAVLHDDSVVRRRESANAQAVNEDARQAGRRTAWSTLIALGLAIGAASLAGLAGARADHERLFRDPRDRVRVGVSA